MGVATSMGPIASGFLNRFGLRITTILGCVLCSVGLAVGSFAPSIIILYIAFSLPFAVGVSLVYVSSTIIATHYFSERRSEENLPCFRWNFGHGISQRMFTSRKDNIQ